MRFYAHTAEDEQGKPLPEDSGQWQPLLVHLRSVASMAKRFVEPIAMGTEAELAGLLHDLGKYAQRFQARLRNPAVIRGINHWAAGACKATELKTWLLNYGIDGHHTGLPSAGDLQQSLRRMRDASLIRELTGCTESVAELMRGFEADGLQLGPLPERHQEQPFASALRTRMLFSCLVDADFLHTEAHFDPEGAEQRVLPTLQAELALRLLLDHLHTKSADGLVNQIRRQLLADVLPRQKGRLGCSL